MTPLFILGLSGKSAEMLADNLRGRILSAVVWDHTGLLISSRGDL